MGFQGSGVVRGERGRDPGAPLAIAVPPRRAAIEEMPLSDDGRRRGCE
jgi:hypothetical protein